MKNIFPSTLIIGPNENIIFEKISLLGHKSINNNPDVLIIDTNYTIDEIRSIKKFFSQKPYNHQNKIVIIYNVDKLRPDAQNALLKTLEEPGKNNYLILTTKKPNSLLGTILSRTHQIKTNQKSSSSEAKIVLPTGKIQNLNIGKDEVLPFLEEQLILHHKLMLSNPKSTTNVKTILKAIDMINHNVDPNLALDYFMLN
jgi:DNA polymerase III delta prime subunit